MRAVMNGVMYILSTGGQWRYIPKDFPPRSTLHDYFTWWICDGTLDRIHHALYVECREKAEREASPTACITRPTGRLFLFGTAPRRLATGGLRQRREKPETVQRSAGAAVSAQWAHPFEGSGLAPPPCDR